MPTLAKGVTWYEPVHRSLQELCAPQHKSPTWFSGPQCGAELTSQATPEETPSATVNPSHREAAIRNTLRKRAEVFRDTTCGLFTPSSKPCVESHWNVKAIVTHKSPDLGFVFIFSDINGTALTSSAKKHS